MRVHMRSLRIRRSAIAIVLGALSAATAPRAQQAVAWPDTFVSRLEALALVQTLNADLLGSRSATATLETWCRDHRLAAEPRVVATLVPSVAVAPTGEQRQHLEVGSSDAVKYRHVRLRCGQNL